MRRRFVLVVIDATAADAPVREAFYLALQARGWNGWDCMPHSFMKQFYRNLDEARRASSALGSGGDPAAVDRALQKTYGFAATRAEIAEHVQEDLREAAAKSGIERWRARVAILPSFPLRFAWSDPIS